jgi:hypothetical protein
MSLSDIKGRPARMHLSEGAADLRDHDRRDHVRRDRLVRRIVAEFDDMPGLALTLNQASRFLAVDRAACARILQALTLDGTLRRTLQGMYVRADRPARNAS